MTGRSILTVAGLLLATLGAALPQATTAPVLGLIAADLDTTTATASWAVTIVLVIAAASAPLIGRLGDAFGARRVMLTLLPVVAGGLLIAALAPNVQWLIAGRVLQGLGGGVFPLAIAVVDASVPPRRRPAVVGLLTASLSVGIGFGALVSGLLVDRFGTRALSWVPLGILLVAEIVVLSTMRHVPRRPDVHLDPLSAITLPLGVIALLLAVTEAPRLPFGAAWAAAGCLVGAGLLVLWYRRERRSRDPLVDPRTLHRRGVWSSHLTAFLLGGALFGAFVLLPDYAEQPTGEGLSTTVTTAGLVLLPAALAMLAVGPLAGILRRRLGVRLPVVLGAAVAALGALLLVLDHRSLAALMIGAALLGIGIATSSAGLVNVLVDVVDADEVGVTTALNITSRQLGGAIGAGTVATLLTPGGLGAVGGGDFGTAFTFVAALSAAAIASALLIPSSRSRDRGRA